MSTVLIIDDSPTELHLFQNMLEKYGFTTLVADSAIRRSGGTSNSKNARAPTQRRRLQKKPIRAGGLTGCITARCVMSCSLYFRRVCPNPSQILQPRSPDVLCHIIEDLHPKPMVFCQGPRQV